MNKIDAIFEKIDQESDIQEIRRDIADMIIFELEKIGNSIGYWEKACFANAISSLAWNINSSHQPMTSWLTLSLLNVERALVPPNRRNENYTPRDTQLNSFTLNQLMSAIRELRESC